MGSETVSVDSEIAVLLRGSECSGSYKSKSDVASHAVRTFIEENPDVVAEAVEQLVLKGEISEAHGARVRGCSIDDVT